MLTRINAALICISMIGGVSFVRSATLETSAYASDDVNHATYVEPPADFKPVIYDQLPAKPRPSSVYPLPPMAMKPATEMFADNNNNNNGDDGDAYALSQNSIVSHHQPAVVSNTAGNAVRPSRWSDWTDMSVEPELVASEPKRSSMPAAQPLDDDPMMMADSIIDHHDQDRNIDEHHHDITMYEAQRTNNKHQHQQQQNRAKYDNTIVPYPISNIWSLKPANSDYFVPPAMIRHRLPSSVATTSSPIEIIGSSSSTTTPAPNERSPQSDNSNTNTNNVITANAINWQQKFKNVAQLNKSKKLQAIKKSNWQLKRWAKLDPFVVPSQASLANHIYQPNLSDLMFIDLQRITPKAAPTAPLIPPSIVPANGRSVRSITRHEYSTTIDHRPFRVFWF